MQTITEKPMPRLDLKPEKPVTITMGTGDYLIITRNGDHDQNKRKAVIKRIIEGMKNRVCNPDVETAEEAIKAMRNCV